MSSSIDVIVPHEIVNDDYVTLVEWHAAPGDPVKSGQTLVSIETSKMVVDVEAPGGGYLEVLQSEAAEVRIGEVIGRVLAEAPTGQAPAPPEPPTPPDANPSGAPAGAKISKKAQVLIDKYGIDPAEFANAGLVKEADVIALLERRQEPPPAADSSDAAPSDSAPSDSAPSADASTADPPPAKPPAGPNGGAGRGYSRSLLGDAGVSAQERGRSLPWLVFNYVFRTWLLGNLVRWAPRGVIMVLHRWRGVKMGRGCFIDPSALVETAYPENITMGDDVRVTAGAVLMTHIKAPHYLRETGIMPAVLQPIVLEDHTFIGVNSVVMPGVTVGKASVVASGSVVVQSVPPYTMVAGNPAKVIRKFPRPDAP